MKFISTTLIFILLFTNNIKGQSKVFTRQDSLRGSITKERVWWNLLHYDLQVKVDIKNQSISGTNTVKYQVLKAYQMLQIDLQEPMQILKVTQHKKNLSFKRDGNAYFIKLIETQIKGDINDITIVFKGKPKVAVKPPWDGGLTWKKDLNKNDFIANSNQGIGASIWWPCKDNPYDEPDNGVDISVTTPKNLMDVSNGRLIDVQSHLDSSKTYHWRVVNPINSYAINMNIANYMNFNIVYQGEKGPLDCSFYVLPYNLEKAKKQFKQVPKMLEAFEYWFGPYPFYEDSYKLVEVPYLGMEHQSSVTYGNGFKNGYLGNDMSGTGWGLKFDFIIIHESGHEWFANNITNKDVADMWLHEGFTTYSEVLYLDYYFGTQAGNEYLIGYRSKVLNDKPIIGKYKVNNHGSNDMYIKAAAMIHTLRQIINDDKKFRAILRGINKEFYHQTVTSKQIEDYISKQTDLNLNPFFDQYLRTVKIPKVYYMIKKNKIKYKYKNTVKNFNMPIRVRLDNKEKILIPSNRWQTIKHTHKNTTFNIDENYFVNSQKVN